MPKNMECVHIIDDDESVQKGFARVLQACGYSVHRYNSAGEFLLALGDPVAGCILLDMKMPGPTGLQLQSCLAKQGISIPIIFVTGFADIPTTVQAMKAGAFDFLTKPVKRDDLVNSVKRALAFSTEQQEWMVALKHARDCFASLSERELQVFAGVTAGRLNKQIAAELGTAERTVKAHRAHLMQKMRVNSVAELVRLADLMEFRSQPPLARAH
jgi:FixJ family two-component response regulator